MRYEKEREKKGGIKRDGMVITYKRSRRKVDIQKYKGIIGDINKKDTHAGVGETRRDT